MTPYDNAVVANLRREYGPRIAQWSDDVVVRAWWAFSGSEDYLGGFPGSFPSWCEGIAKGEIK